jgi:hypothetical protein
MEAQSQNNKILVAYFSWSGNAKALAGQIARETGGDLFEIKTAKAYPDIYNECIEVAKQEQNKTVYASPPGLGLRKTAVGLTPFVRFFSATFLRLLELLRNSFITTAKTSYTARTLCAILPKIF